MLHVCKYVSMLHIYVRRTYACTYVCVVIIMCGRVQYVTLPFTALHYIVFISLQCTTRHETALHWITLRCSALQYTTHSTAPITLHYIALHYRGQRLTRQPEKAENRQMLHLNHYSHYRFSYL